MEVGMIQVAADEDFEKLWKMVLDNSWKLEYQHEEINVWSKHSNSDDVKIIKVCIFYKSSAMNYGNLLSYNLIEQGFIANIYVCFR